MIVRIVRMTFRRGEEKNFIKIFNASQDKIRNFDGCNHVELWRGLEETNVFTTYSHWESEEHLNAYRHSDLFASVWTKTKALFADKPVAHSYTKF